MVIEYSILKAMVQDAAVKNCSLCQAICEVVRLYPLRCRVQTAHVHLAVNK